MVGEAAYPNTRRIHPPVGPDPCLAEALAKADPGGPYDTWRYRRFIDRRGDTAREESGPTGHRTTCNMGNFS
jgi:hypothetical protein